MIDPMVLMSGSPLRIGGILFRQPDLGQIYRNPDIGSSVYESYLYVIGLDVEQFLQITGLTDIYMGLDAELREQIGIFDLLSTEPHWRELLINALSFFAVGTVYYDQDTHELLVAEGENHLVLTKEIYGKAREFIMRSACMKYKEQANELRFYNNRAKEAWERLMKHKEEMRKKPQKTDPSYSIWNVIGAVTTKHPSINLINVWKLTPYQLYDQFARIRDLVSFDVFSTRWAVWGKDKFDYALWFKQDQDNKV